MASLESKIGRACSSIPHPSSSAHHTDCKRRVDFTGSRRPSHKPPERSLRPPIRSMPPGCRSAPKAAVSTAGPLPSELPDRDAPLLADLVPIAGKPLEEDPLPFDTSGRLAYHHQDAAEFYAQRAVLRMDGKQLRCRPAKPMRFSTEPSQKPIALARSAAHLAGERYRQGEACSGRSSRALRQTTEASGSMVGAKSEAIRPSYGRLVLLAMRSEAGLLASWVAQTQWAEATPGAQRGCPR